MGRPLRIAHPGGEQRLISTDRTEYADFLDLLHPKEQMPFHLEVALKALVATLVSVSFMFLSYVVHRSARWLFPRQKPRHIKFLIEYNGKLVIALWCLHALTLLILNLPGWVK